MHILAYFYHWSHLEIVNLPRTERQMWFEQIDKQIKAENNTSQSSNT